MKVINQTTANEPIDAVRPHPRNPRKGDIDAIHTSINANGFYGTIIAQRSTGYILAGNHRWQAARQSGAASIPVTWIDVNDEHALRILLADNRTNDLATYDLQILADLLQNVDDITATGYQPEDLDQILNELEEPAFPKKERLQLSKNQELIRPIISVQDAHAVEKAFAKTGIPHRGQAFLEICRAYNES